MEAEASESVTEQTKMEIAIKTEVEMAATSTAHIDSDINLNRLKQETLLVQCVKNEPALLVKEEILMDSSRDGNEQQYVQGTLTPADAASGKAACGTSGTFLHVKQELEDMDIGPTVLQPMDIHYKKNKKNMSAVTEESTMDDCNEAMPDGGVKKESAEDKLIEHKKLHVWTSEVTGSAIAGPTHTGESSYQYDMGDARFAQNGALTKHTRDHTGEKPYQCTKCVARFAQNANLTKHMRVHTGEKPYRCTTCDARFAQHANLTKHMRVHTGEKPYQCTTCDSRFAQSGALTMHMRVHTGEKPYQCNTCDARFAERCVLTVHMRVHTGEKPYQCTICGRRFARSYSLTSHMRIHTG